MARGVNIQILMTDILAPEILAHTITPRALQVGDLAVWRDRAGREVGCTVTRAWKAGEITTAAQVEIKMCGLSVPAPYYIGCKLVVDATAVRRAV